MRDKYFFVGLTEEFVRSVNVLEALLPDWFAGASEELGKMARMKELTLHNPLTGTNMTGCVSDEAKDFLKAHEPSCSQELEFYDGVKQLFWQVRHLVITPSSVKQLFWQVLTLTLTLTSNPNPNPDPLSSGSASRAWATSSRTSSTSSRTSSACPTRWTSLN